MKNAQSNNGKKGLGVIAAFMAGRLLKERKENKKKMAEMEERLKKLEEDKNKGLLSL